MWWVCLLLGIPVDEFFPFGPRPCCTVGLSQISVLNDFLARYFKLPTELDTTIGEGEDVVHSFTLLPLAWCVEIQVLKKYTLLITFFCSGVALQVS